MPGGATGAAAFDHSDHLERIDAEEEARDHDDDERAAAQLDPAAARKSAAAAPLAVVAAILDVVAAAKISPSHDLLSFARHASRSRASALADAASRYGFSAR